MNDIRSRQDLGARLRDHRQRAGLTQRQLADLTTVSVRAIRNLEQGKVLSPGWTRSGCWRTDCGSAPPSARHCWTRSGAGPAPPTTRAKAAAAPCRGSPGVG